MATNYRLKIHPQVINIDIPSLPKELQQDWRYFQDVLRSDPYQCRQLPCHVLTGALSRFRTIEVEFEGDKNSYRLVYRIYEKPSPRHILVISFDRHDAAYKKAKARRRQK